MFLILDSGHNEQTQGKRSDDGTIVEWEYTYLLAEAIREKLLLRADLNVMHLDNDRSRNGRTDSEELNWRVRLANAISDTNAKIGLDTMLISIHLDAHANKEACGATVYIAEKASKATKMLSSYFATNIRKHHLEGNRACQIRTGNFAILRDTKCPAILVECAFMTNEHDKNFLKSKEGFESIVLFFVDSILKYLSNNS